LKNITPTRAWIAFFGIWFILLTGTLDFWLQTPGLKQWYRVQANVSERRQEIADIEAKTGVLQEVAKQLESNSAAQEREIRKVLGYLGDQEVVFEFSR
jgi:cell division protein FtsB